MKRNFFKVSFFVSFGLFSLIHHDQYNLRRPGFTFIHTDSFLYSSLMNFPISLQDTRLYLHLLYSITKYNRASHFSLLISIRYLTYISSYYWTYSLIKPSSIIQYYLDISINMVVQLSLVVELYSLLEGILAASIVSILNLITIPQKLLLTIILLLI